MAKWSFRKRSPEPLEAFGVAFDAAMKRFGSDFLASKEFRHALTKGEESEIPVREFFKKHLPTKYEVISGEAVDLNDDRTPQLDIMIYDSSKNFPFFSADSELIPAEALLVAIEVKSKLTLDAIQGALRAAQQLKSLHPFREEVAEQRRDGEHADERSRYFYSIFAYETDLGAEDWDLKEYKRISEIADELNLSMDLIDRIYVANKGLLMPGEGKGMCDQPDDAAGLLYFYMHTYNFLVRENSRRDPSPYLEYAGRMARGWRDL